MKKDELVLGVLIEETTTVSFTEVCVKYNIPKELLVEMIEYGLFSAHAAKTEQTQLHPNDLRRMESAFRLHKDLGVNLPGVALALDLLDELAALRKELDILRRHF